MANIFISFCSFKRASSDTLDTTVEQMTGLGEGEFPANRLHCPTRFDETRLRQLNKKITEVAVECKATLNLRPSRVQREA